jgi:hypothetical protein
MPIRDNDTYGIHAHQEILDDIDFLWGIEEKEAQRFEEVKKLPCTF